MRTPFACLVLVLYHCLQSREKAQAAREEYSQISCVVGTQCFLPCDVTTSQKFDDVQLVLYYKNDLTAPIFSFDTRESSTRKMPKWKSESPAGDDVFFKSDAPSGLVLKEVLPVHAGIYKCRVDFSMSPTKITITNVSLIVPPGKPLLRNVYGEKPKQQSEVVNEGDSLFLRCLARRGSPPGRLQWLRGSEVLHVVVYEAEEGWMASDLVLANVGRENDGQRLTCLAINNDKVVPNDSVSIDLNLRPVSVQILGYELPLRENVEYSFSCVVCGSKPNAEVSWTLDGEPLPNSVAKMGKDNKEVLSTLVYKANPEDNNRTLACSGYNPVMRETVLADSRVLRIHFKPIVVLALGSSLNQDDLKEGDDIYFTCMVTAVPQADQISWWKDDSRILPNVTFGVIIINFNLAIRKITRKVSGNYSCSSCNSEGSATSAPIPIRIRHHPVCDTEETLRIRVPLREEAAISCPVSSHPPPVRFHWSFNRSQGDSGDSGSTHGPVLSPLSASGVLKYRPESRNHYGFISCWSANALGTQKRPCVMEVKPMEVPESPHSCIHKIENSHTISLKCKAGCDGGLSQLFAVEILSKQTDKIKERMLAKEPAFHIEVDNLEKYKIIIYAFNSLGKSAPVMVESRLLQLAEWKPETLVSSSRYPEVLGVVFGLLALIAIGLLFATVVRKRCCSSRTPEGASGNFRFLKSLDSGGFWEGYATPGHDRLNAPAADEGTTAVTEDEGLKDRRTSSWTNGSSPRPLPETSPLTAPNKRAYILSILQKPNVGRSPKSLTPQPISLPLVLRLLRDSKSYSEQWIQHLSSDESSGRVRLEDDIHSPSLSPKLMRCSASLGYWVNDLGDERNRPTLAAGAPAAEEGS